MSRKIYATIARPRTESTDTPTTGPRTPDTTEGESAVIWVEDPASFPYVREVYGPTHSRRSGIRVGSGRVVAYATLKPTVPSEEGFPGVFYRRHWYVTSWDPYPGGPGEAVVPQSIQPGRPSSPYWEVASQPEQ